MPNKNNYFDLYPTVQYKRPSFLIDTYSLVLDSIVNFEIGETVTTDNMSAIYVGTDENQHMVVKLQSGNIRPNSQIFGQSSNSIATIVESTRWETTANDITVNLTSLLVRYDLSKSVRGRSTLFYPYLWRDYDRPDTIANLYYGNPSLHWILMNSANSNDLYYGFPLASEKLNRYLMEKYKDLIIESGVSNWADLSYDNKILQTYNYLEFIVKFRYFYFIDKPDEIFECDEDLYNYYKYETLQSISNVSVNLGSFKLGEQITNGLGFTSIFLKQDNLGNFVVGNQTGSVSVGNTLTGIESGAEANINVLSTTTSIRTYQNEIDEAFNLTPSVYLPAAGTKEKSLLEYEFENNEAKREVSVLDNDYAATIVKEFKIEMNRIRSERAILGDV